MNGVQQEEITDLKQKNVKLQKRLEELDKIILSLHKRENPKNSEKKDAFLVGEHVFYCSTPANKKGQGWSYCESNKGMCLKWGRGRLC
eukprot:1227657-Ditylum_brightwellii.AAC.1